MAGLASSLCWQCLDSWHSSLPASFLVNINISVQNCKKGFTCCIFSASPEPGPRPLKTEAEIEAGSEAFTNNNIVKNKTEEMNKDGEDVKGGKEDIGDDPIDDEHQTCLTENSQ